VNPKSRALRLPGFRNVLLVAALTLPAIAGCQTREASAAPSEPEAEARFIDYLKIDTSNPPGNETEASKFFQQILTSKNVESHLAGPDPSRQSIWARLSSGKPAPALLLLHHLDVVPANAQEWTVPPFSGRQANGYIWGRGSLDIKSLGIAQLEAFLDLAEHPDQLDRDVIFLGVADEEAGGTNGTEWLLDHHPEIFQGVGLVLNEGGANEVIVDRVAYWGIEVDQKVPLWLRLTTTGIRGHGAVPPDDGGASARLVGVLGDVLSIESDYRVVPSVNRYFRSLATTKRGRKRAILSDVGAHLGDADLQKVLSPGYRSLLRDTMVVTTLAAGSTVNVVPGRASAEIDMRLLPGESPDAMLQKIREICAKRAEVEVLLRGEPIEPSSADSRDFARIANVMRAAEPGSTVGTLVTPGTTDCRFFRAGGITCFGMSPFKINYYDGDNVHGVDEKIRARFFAEGVALMRSIARALATTSGG